MLLGFSVTTLRLISFSHVFFREICIGEPAHTNHASMSLMRLSIAPSLDHYCSSFLFIFNHHWRCVLVLLFPHIRLFFFLSTDQINRLNRFTFHAPVFTCPYVYIFRQRQEIRHSNDCVCMWVYICVRLRACIHPVAFEWHGVLLLFFLVLLIN